MEIDNTALPPQGRKRADVQPITAARELSRLPVVYAANNMHIWQCLTAEGIQTVGDLLRAAPNRICKIKNLGGIPSAEIQETRSEILRDPDGWLRRLRQKYRIVYLDGLMVKSLSPLMLARLVL